MATQRHDDEHIHEQGTTGKTMKRRGILAAAGAVVAGIVAKQASAPVQANTNDFLILGTSGTGVGANSAEAPTALTYDGGTLAGRSMFTVTDGGTTSSYPSAIGGFVVNGRALYGVYGFTSADGAAGVIGVGGFTHGVQGMGGTHSGSGVVGVGGAQGGAATHPGSGVVGVASGALTPPPGSDYPSGVIGTAIGIGGGGYGVIGRSDGGTGVFGTAVGGATPGVGVAGSNGNTGGTAVQGNASGDGSIGVQGISDAPSGYGVYGTSRSGIGVYGTSTRSFGGWFESGGLQGNGGVVGVARAAGTVGFQALAVSPATYAGYFTGTVSISGSLGVTGSKFAVVKGQDGQFRGMYAVESPECWFEDFGEGTIVNGKATVKLDSLFAQHIHTDSYHVFLTPHVAEHHLAATTRAGQSFSVEASVSAAGAAKGKQASDLTGTFSWRVVAKRNDIAGERMPVWEMPAPPHIRDPPKFEPPPPPVKKP